MLKVSYDNKPLPPNIKRIRLNVIDSFINEEKLLLSEKITKLLAQGKSKKILKKIYEYSNSILNNELENKRLFQIKLKCILSCRLPESIEYIKKINEENTITVKSY
jgi:hypothetical protein